MKRKSEEEQPVAGKVAIIVGGSSGIGEGIVRDFAKRGARVVIVYNMSIERAEKIANELNRKYRSERVITVQANTTDEEVCTKNG